MSTMYTPPAAGVAAPDDAMLGAIDWRALRTEPRRDTIRELHGYRGPGGPWGNGPDEPAWPEPYQRSFGSEGFVRELQRPIRRTATQRWEHGFLTHVSDAAEHDRLRALWGERRTAGAVVGPLSVPELPPRDRELIREFCASRGWQRLLVRAWEHVGCKAAHVGQLSADGLRRFGEAGAAVLAARSRHRLAVLEELLRAHGGDAAALRGRLDRMDRQLDAVGMGESFWMAQLPDHCNDLMPIRNLMRLADREGMVYRSFAERDFGEENSYCPEIVVLCVDPEIYGGGIMNHDVTHFLLPVLMGEDPLAFEVGNNGIEGDGQYYNNLIFVHRHSGPDYEGDGAWSEPRIFEVLERAFGVASFPEAVIAGRTLTVVLHEAFKGEPEAVLRQLVGTLGEGSPAVRREVLAYFINHVRHDHGFLHRLWPRYLTPLFPEWREHFGERIVDTLEALCRQANDRLWEIEDIDLRTFDHPLRGRLGERLRRIELLGHKLVELRHLVGLAPTAAPGLRSDVARAFSDLLALRDRCRALGAACGAAVDEVPPWERDPGRLAELNDLAEEIEAARAALTQRSRGLVEAVRMDQRTWAEPIRQIPPDFIDGWIELFQDFLNDGHYYQHPWHDPEDKIIEIERDDGTRELLKSNRHALGASLDYADFERAVRRGARRPGA